MGARSFSLINRLWKASSVRKPSSVHHWTMVERHGFDIHLKLPPSRGKKTQVKFLLQSRQATIGTEKTQVVGRHERTRRVRNREKMRANANLVIECNKVILVPYLEAHVLKYHAWMQRPDLLELTASEPLTLKEEYAMQKSWREDDDKCTFIVLDRSRPSDDGLSEHGGAMAGDVNLYFNDPENKKGAEIEVMIAEERSQRRGLATEALRAMILYAVLDLGCTGFVAKITVSNTPSLALFKKLGFTQISNNSAIFQEVHLELKVTDDLVKSFRASLGTMIYSSVDVDW